MIQIYNNKHLTWDGTTSINHYELFADTVSDLPSDPYYFSSPDKGSYKMAQGSIAWVIDVSEIYMLDSGGTWVLESISGGGGGGGGTTNYNALTNKPSINSVELNGNKTLSDLGIQPVIDSSHKLSADNVSNGTTNKFNMQADWNQADNTAGDFIKNKPTLGTAAATDATAYATAAQGTKADSAIQSVKIGGSALTPDTNKAVNITSIPSNVTATTQSQKDNSTKIATTAYVDKAVDDLPEPMVWTGTITITADTSDTTKCSIVVSKPASATNIKNGFTYKIASIASSPVYTGTLKVGDTLIAAKDAPTVTSTWVDGTDWNIVPSGDEPSGTVMSVTASNGLKTASGSAITDTGDIQANLASTTALSGNTIYNVGLNSSGNLAVKVPTVSKTAVGLTPQLPNESSTTKFLRQDGSWEVPAYTTVTEGSANGTVKVNNSDVAVHGLGTAAYTASSAYATSTQGGKADSAVQSAGTGLSKSGTTLNHSNSVTAKTTQGFAQIAYDAQGHITGSTAATTAQANAINSGITSTDVEQIETNKNNISFVASQGRKNVLKFDSVGGGSPSGITYTINDDGTVRASGTANATSYAYLRLNNSNFDVKKYTNGQFVLSGCPSGGGSDTYSLYAAKGNYAKYDYGDGVVLTPTSETEVSVVLRVEKNQTVDIVFKPMIRLIGTDSTFEPYAPTNAELTAKEQVDEKNISSLTANGGGKNLLNNSSPVRLYNATYSNGTVTQITNDTKSTFVFSLQGYSTPTTYVKTLNQVDTTKKGRIRLSFTKDNTFSIIAIGHSGATEDCKIFFDISNLANGDYYAQINLLNYQQSQGKYQFNELMIYDTKYDMLYQPYALSNAVITPGLIELVDSGAKNLLKITATSQTISGVTFTVNSTDGTITANGTATARIALQIARQGIRTGKYVLSNNIATSAETYWLEQYVHYSSTSHPYYQTYDNGTYVSFSITQVPEYTVTYLIITSGQTVSNLVFKPMLCTAEDYAISSDFVPYAMSNAELTNNISSLIDSTYGTAHNINLDTLTKGGRYLVNGAESSTSNAPFANWQVVEVYESNIDGYTTLTVQIATELGAGLARKFRRRTYSGGGQYSAWTTWTS